MITQKMADDIANYLKSIENEPQETKDKDVTHALSNENVRLHEKIAKQGERYHVLIKDIKKKEEEIFFLEEIIRLTISQAKKIEELRDDCF